MFRSDCKHFNDCPFQSDTGHCPNRCVLYRHKDDVRVVRCKNCKHTRKKTGREQSMYNENVCICTKDDIWGVPKNEPVWGDGFCSYGERKEK